MDSPDIGNLKFIDELLAVARKHNSPIVEYSNNGLTFKAELAPLQQQRNLGKESEEAEKTLTFSS